MDSEAAARTTYLTAIGLVERVQRRLFDVVKDEFDRRDRKDVCGRQALLLYNIGDKKLTEPELATRAHFLGVSVTVDADELLARGFLRYEPDGGQRERMELSKKGREVADIVGALFDRHVGTMAKFGGPATYDLDDLNETLRRLERYWTDLIRYRL